MIRRVVIGAVVALVVTTVAYALFWPCWIDPVAWTPDADPGLTGVYAPNDALTRVERLAEGVNGPEDVEQGPDLWMYASLRDGRIIRFDPTHPDTFHEFANTHGFPLGLEFDSHGQLIVADGDLGLLSISREGRVAVLLNGIDGKRFRFADDLAIADDGTIYFSDAYAQGPADLQMQVWEGRATGRLVAFHPVGGKASVCLDSLSYANGVTLGPGQAYVLITEMLRARVARYWISGPKKGTHDVFINALPGYPDNLAFDGAGLFWMALVTPRPHAFERWSRYPVVRQFVAKAPLLQAPHPVPSLRDHRYMGWVLGVDTTGVVHYNLQSPVGDYGALTSANAFDGYLYLGSIRMTSVGRLRIADLNLVRAP